MSGDIFFTYRGFHYRHRDPDTLANAERDKKIVAMRRSGKSYAAVGKAFNLSGTRISQIMRKAERVERYRAGDGTPVDWEGR